MRFSVTSTFLLLEGIANAASSWTFSDGSVTVASKKATGEPQKFTDKAKLQQAVVLGSGETIKVSLTTQDGNKGKRPHQAILMIKESSGLEAPFALNVKESGKAVAQISHKDLPIQLLTSPLPLEVSLILGSFGSTKASVLPVFDFTVDHDPNTPAPTHEAPLRYGKLAEIHHIFRDDPKNPPKIVSLFFALAVVATLPVLFVAWIALGANVDHLPKALGTSPASHAVFIGSIIGMEVVFLLYYSSWNLFQTLPVATLVGLAAFLSGSRALGEVRSRRLAGER